MHGGLTRTQIQLVTWFIVAVHVLMVGALLQMKAEPLPVEVGAPAPVFVDLIAPVAPASQPPKQPPRVLPPSKAPIVATRKPSPTVFETPVDVVREPTPDPVPAHAQETPVPAVPSPAVPAVSTAPVAAVAPPPVIIPPSAVQYLVPPALEYPASSRRLGESGRVTVRVYIDEAGLPRQVLVSQSSGFSRLDNASLAAVRQARFKPYMLNGRAAAGWASIPFNFDLEQ